MERMSNNGVLDMVSPARLYNMPPPVGVSPSPPGIERAAGPSVDHLPLFSPDNPLFWFGALLAATLGLIAVSGSIRVGPASVSGQVGKTTK